MAPWFQRAPRRALVDPRRTSTRQTPEWWHTYWQRLNVQSVIVPETYEWHRVGDSSSNRSRRDGHAVVMSHDIGLLDRATVTAHPD